MVTTKPRMILKKAISAGPASIRTLAREAGVSHVTLLKVRNGDARLTPKVARGLVRALRKWSRLYADLADKLEKGGFTNE